MKFAPARHSVLPENIYGVPVKSRHPYFLPYFGAPKLNLSNRLVIIT